MGKFLEEEGVVMTTASASKVCESRLVGIGELAQGVERRASTARGVIRHEVMLREVPPIDPVTEIRELGGMLTPTAQQVVSSPAFRRSAVSGRRGITVGKKEHLGLPDHASYEDIMEKRVANELHLCHPQVLLGLIPFLRQLTETFTGIVCTEPFEVVVPDGTKEEHLILFAGNRDHVMIATLATKKVWTMKDLRLVFDSTATMH